MKEAASSADRRASSATFNEASWSPELPFDNIVGKQNVSPAAASDSVRYFVTVKKNVPLNGKRAPRLRIKLLFLFRRCCVKPLKQTETSEIAVKNKNLSLSAERGASVRWTFFLQWDLLSCLARLLLYLFLCSWERVDVFQQRDCVSVCEGDELLTVWPIKHPPHPSFICLPSRPPMSADLRHRADISL